MKTHDRHSVHVDVNEDGSDVWEAIWGRDGFIRIYRGDSQNNKILMQHILSVEFNVEEAIPLQNQIEVFVAVAANLLDDMIFKGVPTTI